MLTMKNWEVLVPYCAKDDNKILGYIYSDHVLAHSKDEAYYSAYRSLRLWGDEDFVQYPCYEEPYLGGKIHRLLADKMKARRW